MKKIILPLVGIGIIIGVGLLVRTQPEPTSNNEKSGISTNLVTEGGSMDTKPVVTPHPVSLPALMVKEYNGNNLKLGRVLAETSTYTRYYVTYTSGELTISGIMNIPKGSGPFPIVIMNHGYIDPAIYTNGRGLRREQDYFASRGYIVFHSDYRNHADSSKDENNETNIRLGYVEDVINAVYAVKNADLPMADTSKIAMIGHSMGGGIAQAIMVTKPDLVQAVMLYAPVSTDVRDSFYRWTTTRPTIAQQIIEQYGAPDTNKTFWDNISPRTFLDNVTTPILINHGDADQDVPLNWSQTTYDLLKTKNKDVTLYVYPGEPHEFAKAWPLVMQRTLEFFDSKF